MKRKIDLDEISDGRRYGLQDMVRADCGDCKGCFSCCQGMGETVVLDPFDMHRLSEGLRCSFEELLEKEKIELHVVDGVVLPNLKMGGKEQKCIFLDGEGRCMVHAFRPGICRMFPLGRIYESGDFSYFLQLKECSRQKRGKIKVKNWLDTPDPMKNHRFLRDWHYFLKDIQESIPAAGQDTAREASLYILEHFYRIPFDRSEDFYIQFGSRLTDALEYINISIN